MDNETIIWAKPSGWRRVRTGQNTSDLILFCDE